MKRHKTGTDNPIDFPLEGKSTVELNLDKEVLYELMLMAHERDITLNQLVEDILRTYIEQKKNK
jgi:predicted HicB family RNase H-like nuclease